MAFVSMLFVFALIFLAAIVIPGFVGVILFVIAGFIALGARKKAKTMARPYKCPASVLVLRIIGTVLISPLLTLLALLVIEQIDNVIHPDTSSGYEEDYDEYYDEYYDSEYDEYYDEDYDADYDEDYDPEYDGDYDEDYDTEYYDGDYGTEYDEDYDETRYEIDNTDEAFVWLKEYEWVEMTKKIRA